MLLQRIPFKSICEDIDICNICKTPELVKHILFDCHYAKKMWKVFCCNVKIWDTNDKLVWKDVLICDKKMSKNCKFFWILLTTEIMWHNWKARNDEKFKGTRRSLTESAKRLTFLHVALQVSLHIEVLLPKFINLVRDGSRGISKAEGSSGHEIFLKAFNEFQRDFNVATEVQARLRGRHLGSQTQVDAQAMGEDAESGQTVAGDNRGEAESSSRTVDGQHSTGVMATMEIAKSKFLKLPKDGINLINQHEVKFGHPWQQGQSSLAVFMKDLEEFQNGFIGKAAGSRMEVINYYSGESSRDQRFKNAYKSKSGN